MKSIVVKDETWQKLTILKAELKVVSIDDVINEVLKRYKKQ
jgi:predicted CopG family antitoxin